MRTVLDIVLSLTFSIRTLKWLRISPKLCSREALHVLLTFGGVVQIQSIFAVTLNSIERAIAAPLVGLEAAGLLDIGQETSGNGGFDSAGVRVLFCPGRGIPAWRPFGSAGAA